MEPDPIVVELQAANAKLDAIASLITAHNAAEVVWMSQMVFLAQAQAIALGIIWGCISWRLILLAKRQSNPFW